LGRFAELLDHDGVEEDVELRSRFGLMAFHGGNLEEGTDVIAAAVAEQAEASLYAVRQPIGLRWHLPSVEIGPADSPALAAFLEHVDVAIAVHGYYRQGWFTTLLLGGQHRALAAHVGTHLRTAMPDDYLVIDELEQIPAELRGVHRANPVNLPRHGGVQLELPPRTRSRTVPLWRDLPDTEPVPHGQDLIAGLVAAVRSWPTD
jgi:phage replication-related protein YjqB (UPF0714/DUF867 family)